MDALDCIRASQGMARPAPAPAERAGEPQSTLWLRDAFLGRDSAAGEIVTVEKSLGLDTVLACVRLISESIGAMPLRTYKRTSPTAVEEAWSYPTAIMLMREPNPEMTGADLWTLVGLWLAAWGNAYLGKAVDATGRVAELWPIHPGRVRVGREGGQKVFYVRGEDIGNERRYTQAQIIHFKGTSLDGLIGLSPIGLASQAIGAGLAMDTYAASFYENSATPRGALTVPGTLTDTAMERLRARWQATFGGARRAHRVAILEGGVEFTPISVPLADAQFVESARLTAQKVCRLFRVAPEMVGLDSGNSLTYSTVEGQALSFVRYTLRPWLYRVEQELNRDRDIFPGDTAGMFCEFDTQDLVRADLKTRYEAYSLALDPQKGWMTPNEVRAWERLPADPAFDRPADSPGDTAAAQQ